MRIAQRVVALVLSIGGLVLPATAASADPYPIISPQLTVSAGTVVVGTPVTVNGTGYGPNETVDVSTTVQTTAIGRLGEAAGVHQLAARAQTTAPTDGDGAFTAVLTLDEVGLVIITGTGRTSGASASATVRVVPDGGALPVTGDDGRNLWLFLIGAAVVAAGVVLVVLTRSRRPARPRG